jgi:gliding motility-associated-like protein
MKQTVFKNIVGVVFFAQMITLVSAAYAVHDAGGDITYTYLGNNQYRIYVTMFRDCRLNFSFDKKQTVKIESTCGQSYQLEVHLMDSTNISQLCDHEMKNSTCDKGGLPGYYQHVYSDTITLPPCESWRMSLLNLARNQTVNINQSSNYPLYLEATLNNVAAPANSSPKFNTQHPIPYLCQNQSINYNYSVTEPNGDSLYYSFTPALSDYNSPVLYTAGYSGAAPIQGISINHSTGAVNFSPMIIGNFIVVVLVEEYNKSNKLIGSTRRDMEFVVMPCSNTMPTLIGGITNVTGATKKDSTTIELCAGNCFSFDATFKDFDAADTLTFFSNLALALPGATVTRSGKNPLKLTFQGCIPAQTLVEQFSFSATINDQACPIPGEQVFAFTVIILNRTKANDDITICGSQQAQLNASGGTVFNWSVLSGPPMTAANFSCNPCANPIASPTATTAYMVKSDLSCNATDTVTVVVVPNFTYTLTPYTVTTCPWEPLTLQVKNVAPTGTNYTYSWSPSTNLNNASIANPTAKFGAQGIYKLSVLISNSKGCVKTDSATITVTPYVKPTITAFADTTICAGQSVRLGVIVQNAPAANYKFLWQPSSATINNVHQQNTTANPTTTTTVTVTVSDTAGGCSATDSVHIVVIPSSPISILQKGPYCINSSIDTMKLSPGSQVSGLWGGDGITNPTLGLFDPAIAGEGTHKISFTKTISCNPISDTVEIVVAAAPTVLIQEPGQQLCVMGTPFNLAASPSGGKWSGTGITNAATGIFDPQIAGVGNHIVKYSVNNPCYAEDTVTVNVISQFNASIMSSGGPYCTNAADVLLKSATTGGVWTGTGISNGGVFSPSDAGPGTHVVTYTIDGPCGNSSTKSIDVIAAPDIAISADTTEGCAPVAVKFSSVVNPQGGHYQWSFGDGGVSPSSNPIHKYTVAGGPYNVSLKYSIAGCDSTSTKSAFVTVHSQPVAHFTANPKSVDISNTLVTFTDESSGVIDNWNWQFSNLASSSDQNTTFHFPDDTTGVYLVKLDVSNNFSCKDTISELIVVEPLITFYAPNTFTPDQNDLNDVFLAKGEGIDLATYQMLIFNRWGTQIFKSNDINVGWDGTYGGKPLQEDIYSWKVNFRDVKKNPHEFIGKVTLVR